MSDKPNTPETDGVEESLWLRYKQAEDITPEDNARELLRESLFFARRLEVKLDQARMRLQACADAAKIEADQLRAEVERLRRALAGDNEGALLISDLTETAKDLRAQLTEARKNLGPAAFGEKDSIYNICLGYHPESNEYEWLRVVPESQLARRDEALKVANGALEISADCFNRIAHGDEEITSGQAESLLCETRNALRRIEELTKEKQPHE